MSSFGNGLMEASLDAKSLSHQYTKYGTVIPNRVFVGGVVATTTESDLRQFFSAYGTVKDCKLIFDRAGISKGYGFITFDDPDDVTRLLKQEGEHVLFKDRKLNIGPAVRKQPSSAPIMDAGVAAGALVYSNGIPVGYPGVMPFIQGHENLGISTLPHMASYPFLVGPQQTMQQIILQPGYYQTAAGGTALMQWPPVQSPQLNLAQPDSGLTMAANGHFPLVGSGHLPLAGHGQSPYYYQYPVSAMLAPQDVLYPYGTGLQYQGLEVEDGSLETSSQLQGPSGVSGHQTIHYLDMCQLTGSSSAISSIAAADMPPVMSASTSSVQTKTGFNAPHHGGQRPSCGVKRVLSIPHQVAYAPSNNPYVSSLYGMPPVKIIAGQGGQRIVAKSVGTTEIQILPKTQA